MDGVSHSRWVCGTWLEIVWYSVDVSVTVRLLMTHSIMYALSEVSSFLLAIPLWFRYILSWASLFVINPVITSRSAVANTIDHDIRADSVPLLEMDPKSDMKFTVQSLTALATRMSDNDSLDSQSRRALQKSLRNSVLLRKAWRYFSTNRIFGKILILYHYLLSFFAYLYRFLIVPAPSKYSCSHCTGPWLVREMGTG